MLTQPKTYYDLKACKKRVAIFQGGTRSGKTYSILTVLVEWCLENINSGYTITVVRKSFPSLRASVLRDFIFILKTENYYSEKYHNKTEVLLKSHIEVYDFIVALTPNCAYNLEKGGTNI